MTNQASLRYTQTDDGVDIAYAIVGQGPPIVVAGQLLAFGIDVSLASRAWMERYAPVLEDHSLVLFDWRGLGASGPAAGELSEETLLSDLRAVIDATGANQVDLCAVRAPCHIATHYAAEHPERVERLVLLEPTAPGTTPESTPRYGVIKGLVSTDWPRFAELFSLIQYGFVDAELARVSRARLLTQFDAGQWDRVNAAVAGFDGYGRGADLTSPTLVIAAADPDQSEIAATRRFVASMRDGRLVTNPGVGARDSRTHWSLVADFLAEGRSDVSQQGRVQTVLFTDLAGSTKMHSRLGDAAARTIVRAHDSAVRQAIAEFDGREVKHTGDGIMASFDSAVEAVSCALQVRDDIGTYNDNHDSEEIQIRFGLNAGEPISEEDDLFGLAVTLAARIGDWGEPGQVLVSDVVRQLLLGKGFEFRSVGEAKLKGFDEAVALYEVTRSVSGVE